jgi:hypothetical protein
MSKKPKSKSKARSTSKPKSKSAVASRPKSATRSKVRSKPKTHARTTAAALGTGSTAIDTIVGIAARSALARFNWKHRRGIAPLGYVKGMAVVFARVLCKLKDGDPAAMEMAKANTGNAHRDALAFYHDIFRAAGMANDVSGRDTLRHLFVLMIGLGMRESSGRYCEGRDRSASNTTAETAEAGLFQTSFNARTASPFLPALFRQFSRRPAGFKEIFQEGVRCKAADLENFGSGPGRDFQRLSKESPGFAVEFAGVALRNIRTHYGPINRKEAQVVQECEDLLLEVQNAVEASPDICPAVL